MMRKIIEGQRTLGITTNYDSSVGTTAEIRSYSEDNDDIGQGLHLIKVKAEGRQRFSVIESWRQPDVNSTDTTLYPSQAPSKSLEFSHWVASNLPLDDSQKFQLLAINCPIQRLRWELSLLQKYSYLCCADRKAKICHKNDIIVISIHGPQGTYVNPSGYVHEMISVRQTSNIALVGSASTELSWLPGYAWTICRCTQSNSHIGWKYSSVNKKLKPEWFWGLCRSSLEPGLKIEDNVSRKPVL